MRSHFTITKLCFLVLFFSLTACTKKDIQFGNTLGESYTNIIQTDTVSVNFSTYILDSFATNTATAFVVGSYADSLLGTTKAKAYLQLMPTLGATTEDNAVFDSLCFIIKLNQYSYGDTIKAQTVSIHQLNEALAYTNSSAIYNTSSFAEAATPLGEKTLVINPHLTDSVVVRLNDAKGREFFSKIQQGDAAFQTSDAFLAYFKGVSIAFNSSTSSAVYGVTKDASSIYMRLYYHTSIPYPEAKWKDFTYYSNLSFNQIITDRSGTKLASLTNNEISSSATGNKAFTQSGAGVLLKMTFPTLRSVLQLDPTVKLLKATLVLRVPAQSYDGKTPLPSTLMLAQTDETNSVLAPLYDATGSSYLLASPMYDNVYDATTYYSFDLTSYINKNLTTSGSENAGLFLMENLTGTSGTIDRAVINSQSLAATSSQLVLSLLTVKN